MAITFGASEPFGTFTGWETQDGGGAGGFEKDRAVARGPTGNEVASQLHNEKIPYEQKLQASVTGANTLPSTIGKLYGLGILESLVITTAEGAFATCDLGGHNHGTNAHTDVLKQVAHGITVNGYGAQDPTGGTATGTGDFYLNGSTTSITCGHDDVLGPAGNQANGENKTPMIDVVLNYVGQVTGFTASGWDVISIKPDPKNIEFFKTTVTLRKALAFS